MLQSLTNEKNDHRADSLIVAMHVEIAFGDEPVTPVELTQKTTPPIQPKKFQFDFNHDANHSLGKNDL